MGLAAGTRPPGDREGTLQAHLSIAALQQGFCERGQQHCFPCGCILIDSCGAVCQELCQPLALAAQYLSQLLQSRAAHCHGGVLQRGQQQLDRLRGGWLAPHQAEHGMHLTCNAHGWASRPSAMRSDAAAQHLLSPAPIVGMRHWQMHRILLTDHISSRAPALQQDPPRASISRGRGGTPRRWSCTMS